MPKWTIKGAEGGFNRKNLYMPCVISARVDDMSPEELQKVYKATYWADNLTNAEWPVMMGDTKNAPVRSRMKKKIVGWMMILGRIALLNPELFLQAVAEASLLYEEQIGSEHPVFPSRFWGVEAQAERAEGLQ